MSVSDSRQPALRTENFGHLRRVGAAAMAFGLVLTGCATGSQPDAAAPSENQFTADAPLESELNIMGYNADADEVARTRADLAEAAIEPATVKAVEGELDVQQFLSAVAAGDAPD
ncbi:hypothetical protein [Paeniglutamicibacter sulfureus]|uniref:ABC-type glycerol-3-phosphate transport system substrate-binding protein n=2 Tax=Paeniglutamicibacter sulfureus TaxID=43666 RepID=A0ABU2BNV1_9MICC|nr:hypothetical protein [Paeniglutamicibacter sulfureus]MDR7360332.1 ABC-type glycerol-3-phosphate transport system substrate-binding protein [Paeniglutamicibacter sulfureus]